MQNINTVLAQPELALVELDDIQAPIFPLIVFAGGITAGYGLAYTVDWLNG